MRAIERVNGGAVESKLREALQFLQRGFVYAQDVGGDPWQFSTELQQLQTLGVDCCDLRWLLAQGWIAHRPETTSDTASTRSFGPLLGSHFGPRSAFLLTENGYGALHGDDQTPPPPSLRPPVFVAGDVGTGGESVLFQPAVEPLAPVGNLAIRPQWRPARRELWYGATLIKRFRVPAPNQELILSAFEEDGWPDCIDDPLPPEAFLEPKRRLQGAIKCLNRNQLARAISFFGTGRGNEVGWTPLDAAIAASAPASPRH